MKMKVEEIKPRASEGDIVELEGKVSHAQKPNEGQYGWSQFIGVKDSTGEQNCWIRLKGEEDKVTKGTSIKIKGKLGEEYEDKKSKKMVRSINNCDFEVSGKVQDHAKSSASSGNGNGTKDNYWEKKFIWDQKVHFSIIRQVAIKAVTKLAVQHLANKKPLPEKSYFEFADKIVDYICKRKTETKEERISEARAAVGKTEFRPVTVDQQKVVYGYEDKEGKWHKGIVESRYITKEEIRDIGDPKNLSVEKAGDKISWWWGVGKEEGERKKREREHPRNENGTIVGSLIEGDKTSVVKDDLIDDINAWRRENFLISDKKFEEELGYDGKLEKLSEEDLLKIKDLLKHYHPKDWDEK